MICKFLTKVDPLDKLVICRFKGAHVKGAPKKRNALSDTLTSRRANNTSETEPGLRTDDAIWEMLEVYKGTTNADKDIVPYYFQNARRDYIREMSRDRGHEWSGEATHYLDTRKALVQSKDAEEKKTLRGQLADIDFVWDQRFLERADIVFCTNSSAAHETLMDWFQPVILLSGEAALASLPDASTACAGFKNFLQHAIVTGDHMQQGPTILSMGANETYKEMCLSLFERLMQEKSIGDKIMLTTQHRMKESFSEMVSQIWYDGKLQNHPSLAQKSPFEETLGKALRQGLGDVWNGRFRLVVDVSSSQAHEERIDNSSSLVNKAEAATVVDHIEWMLGLKYDFRIEPKHIMVITPYNGQVSYIRQLLAQRRVGSRGNDVSVGLVDVMTSAAVQDGERDIVLVSWVVNTPGKPLKLKFTRDSKQACVNFSRVKNYQVTFGNWLPWMQASIDSARAMTHKRGKLLTFGKIVQDHYDKGDALSLLHLHALHRGEKLDPDDGIYKKLVAPSAALAPMVNKMKSAFPATAFGQMSHNASQRREADQKKRKRDSKKTRRAGVNEREKNQGPQKKPDDASGKDDENMGGMDPAGQAGAPTAA